MYVQNRGSTRGRPVTALEFMAKEMNRLKLTSEWR